MVREKAKKKGFENLEDWNKSKNIDRDTSIISSVPIGNLKKLAKEYGKEFNREFIKWAKENNILVRDVDIYRKCTERKIKNAGCKSEKEYCDKNAQKLGYKNYADYIKERRWNRGVSPASENPDCSKYFGEFIAQNFIMKTFENPTPSHVNNPQYDWTCENGLKIECKAACLMYDSYGNSKFTFPIDYNSIADYFILSGWNNREYLQPIYIWIFHKNDNIRKRYDKTNLEKFWKRDSIVITNKPKYLNRFKKYEYTDRLNKLKELLKEQTEYDI